MHHDRHRHQIIALSDIDRAILESYKDLCDGLADYLGDGYEFVLHSLENLDQSVIKIINGSYTGRKEGSPITDLALQMLEKVNEHPYGGHISYCTKNKKGDPLHSCTISIKGEHQRIIGLLCINFYLNTPLYKFLGNLLDHEKTDQHPSKPENFVDNTTELIRDAVCQIRDEVMADLNITHQSKNKEIIARLSDRGIFKLKNSVLQCSEILGITKNTVYMHLRNKTR